MLPQPGTYRCFAGERVLQESKNRALMFVMTCMIDEQTSIKSYNVLINCNGDLNTRTIDNLKEVFGWDGADPFWLVESPQVSSAQFEIVVEMNNYNNNDKPAVKWINKPGAQKSVDKQDIMAKYGAKFRAMAGAKPQQSQQTQQVQQTQAPSMPSTPPVSTQQKTLAIPPKGVLPSTGENAWKKLCTCMPNASQEEATAFWHKVLSLVGKNQADFTEMDWGGVEAAINVYFDEVV